MVVTTTVGRVIFNDILHAEDAVLQPGARPASSSRRIIADCYQILGRARDDRAARPHEGPGLPRVDPLGPVVRHRRPARRRRPRTTILDEAEKEVDKAAASSTSAGIITEQERYNKVIDAWTHARERDHQAR